METRVTLCEWTCDDGLGQIVPLEQGTIKTDFGWIVVQGSRKAVELVAESLRGESTIVGQLCDSAEKSDKIHGDDLLRLEGENAKLRADAKITAHAMTDHCQQALAARSKYERLRNACQLPGPQSQMPRLSAEARLILIYHTIDAIEAEGE